MKSATVLLMPAPPVAMKRHEEGGLSLPRHYPPPSVNLAPNARDAASNGGKLTIERATCCLEGACLASRRDAPHYAASKPITRCPPSARIASSICSSLVPWSGSRRRRTSFSSRSNLAASSTLEMFACFQAT